MKVKWIKSETSNGGNVTTYYGQFYNGNYFMYNSTDTIVLIYDADVSCLFTDEFLNEIEDSYVWEALHRIGECNIEYIEKKGEQL